jgi:phenylalanyl-tRNA synthetase beta chain
MVAGVACGTTDPEQWGEPRRELDFFDVKADVEALLGLTGPDGGFIFSPVKRPALHPGQSARILRGDTEIGWLGSLSPQVAQAMGLKGRIVLFELSLEALGQGPAPSYAALSRFPAIRRDLAVVVDASLNAGNLWDTVRETAGAWLIDLQLFDIYVGKGIDSNRKSLALGLTLQHQSRTLKDDEVDRLIQKVVQRLRDELGADLRE